MTHLFLGLNTRGYGKTLLGLRVANELHAAGNRCLFLAHESAAPLLDQTPFVHIKTTGHSMALLKFTLLTVINQAKPDSIILSDYYTSVIALERAGIDRQWLTSFGVPVGAIDTWDLAQSGTAIDVFGDERRHFEDWRDILDFHMIPVPVANPITSGPYYCCLPEPTKLAKKVRRHIRRDFGMGDSGKAVLFCTADWQHAKYPREDGNRIARCVPRLLEHYVEMLGDDVHLVHVGPSRFPMSTKNYHWLPPLPPERFDMLLASVDLLLTANAAAATVAKALISDVPVVGMINSKTVGSVDDLEAVTEGTVSKRLGEWLREAAPVYPFYMWPIGYYHFLKPLLDGNRYCEAVPMLEMLDEASSLTKLSDLLFSDDALSTHMGRQASYVESIQSLPSGASLVRDTLARAS